ncbi:MAG: glycosyltransferase [Bdellovibrionota bacterium]
MEKVRVFVGTDRSQLIGVKVLEYSIRQHTDLPVEVVPMMDLPVRPPIDPKQDQRTGFSFSRFCIPRLCNYEGRAIYMDADMLVFKDIRSLWEIPFDGAKVIIQEELTAKQSSTEDKKKAPKKRIKQCSVMLLDLLTARLGHRKIVDGLDDKAYDYAGLMFDMCLLQEEEIAYRIPFAWNSLEHWDQDTALIHYTDMGTQPWVCNNNRHGALWVKALRSAIDDGFISLDDVKEDIHLGYARPSLLWELKMEDPGQRWYLTAMDKLRGFRAHRVAYENRVAHLKQLRLAAGVPT